MKKNYQTKTVPAATAAGVSVPERVTIAMGELAGAVEEGLLALAVAAGLQVMQTMMNEDVIAVCGPKGRHDTDRAAVRHGSEDGSVTLGGRRVPVRRPRVRTADGTAEVPVASYELFSSTELLGRMAMERMLAKLSTRRYGSGLEPVGVEVDKVSTSKSKSAVSRRFVTATERALGELMAADLSQLDLVALMVDGVHFAGHCCVVALGIGIDGTKHPLGLVEGSTENATLVTDLIVDLRDRGLDVTKPILAVIDGSKALRRAVLDVFDHPVIHRCQLHKVRGTSSRSCPTRWLRRSLPRCAPPTATSIRWRRGRPRSARPPTRQGTPGSGGIATRRTRRDPHREPPRRAPDPGTHVAVDQRDLESMIEICRDHSTNVKRWRDGQMVLRWCAAGMLEATKQFRRVNGYLHLPALRVALDAHINGTVTAPRDTEQTAA